MTRTREILCENCPSGFQKYFINLDKADLQFLNEEKITSFHKKGQLIYEEGQKSPGVYCVREGKIKVYKNSQDGREHIIRVALPGEFLGLKSLQIGRAHV